MKDDLIERLRRIADAARRPDGTDIPLGMDLREAADALERFQADRDAVSRETLKEAAKVADSFVSNDDFDSGYDYFGMGRSAGAEDIADAIRSLIPASQPQDTDANEEGRDHG